MKEPKWAYELSVWNERMDEEQVKSVVLYGKSLDEVRDDVSECWRDGWVSMSLWEYSGACGGWLKRMKSEKNPSWRVVLMLKEVV